MDDHSIDSNDASSSKNNNGIDKIAIKYYHGACKLAHVIIKMKDRSCGTFMFWKIGNQSTNDKNLRKQLMFYEFLRDYNKNDDLGSGIEFKPAVSGIGPITNVIDGQQRITSLLIGLTGSYFKNRAASKLYINLNMRKKSSEEEKEFKYEFKFLSDSQFNRHYKKLQKIFT